MIQKISKLLIDLNEQLNFIDLEIDNPILKSEKAIEVSIKSKEKLKILIQKSNFKSDEEEIQFFKEIKPQFTSKIIYYNTVFNIEMKKPNGGARVLKKYYNNELIKLKAFFDNELEFYKYYRTGNIYLDYKYFLRGKIDIKLSVNSYYFETDKTFSTSHDYKVAKILANDLIQLYLENQLIMIENKDNNEKSQRKPNTKMAWTGSKVALTELLYAIHSEGVFNNDVADLKDITEDVTCFQFLEADGRIRDYFWFKKGNFLVVMEKITPDYMIISCFHIDDARNQKYYEDKYTKRVNKNATTTVLWRTKSFSLWK